MNPNKILLIHPRLDIPFKKFHEYLPPKDYSNLEPIRRHWSNFYDMISATLPVDTITAPMWTFDEKFYEDNHANYDMIIVPHRQPKQFPNLAKEITDKMIFVMQTVFPELFTMDRNGWGPDLSFLPLPVQAPTLDQTISFNTLAGRIASNISKFGQPNAKPLKEEFDVLFVCQIPHDETIKYHSDVEVDEALVRVLETAKAKGYKVLVKGHPVNPDSMMYMRNTTNRYYNATWIDNVSIHDAIRASKVVALVNSGVGFEAMLHRKPIFSYGRSEYQNVVNYKKDVDINNINVLGYSSFIHEFCSKCLDTTNMLKFQKQALKIVGEK